ncbi:MAG: DUF6807 family protein [Balneolaceae bacterium]
MMKELPSILIITITGSTLLILFLAGCSSEMDNRNEQNQADPVRVTKSNSSMRVTAGDHNLKVTPFAIEWEDAIPSCMESNGLVVPAQAEQTEDGRTLLWILTEVPAGVRRVYVPSQQTNCSSSTFRWEKVGSERSRLQIDGLPAIEYVHPVFDPDRAEETMKPYHHVYAPDGSQLITKGGTDGLYPHHRGIFYGYRNIHVQEDTVNTWASGNDLESTQHVRFLNEWTGPVFGGHEVAIDWRDGDGMVFADERRKVRVYRRPDGEMLIDVESVLSTRVGPVELGGDLQHAGLQFRAAQYVADHPEYSRYLRPEQWSDIPSDEEYNDTEQRLDDPWNAFRFVVEGDPYTVGYFSHPQNPSGGQMSERLYGRFGEFSPGVIIDEGEPLHLHYRFLIVRGHEIGRERMEGEYAAYTAIP